MHSKFQNDDIEVVARRISKLLIGQKTPISVDHICQKLKDVESDMLKKVIDKYQNHFHVFQQPVVKLMTKIDICKIHCSKNRTCPGTEPLCTGLHICKYYILSSKCHFDKHCTFGHDVRTDHNMKILQENLLADITVDELKFLLSSADNRTSLTVPRICKFYNVENDKCRHSERGSLCPDIHICKHFVLGTCKFGKDCLRSHGVLEKRNGEILSKHGIDVNKTETEIVKDLRKGISGIASRYYL
ncbi:protein mono-ADP-ribosyltransferase PARP12-like [Mercenaria mercenaria]|uniref:protein mono-ADP-ribosyltransferase PARP12-like n=1 Tax=Mercenaria mercenaria TaxID=6596 RepID=UPI00234F1B7E|nr:protein mono-ADP-ribosyltransferase PARP12-like [Mercenaria mercenaria]XP_053388840.1 protein mono-ADP-ribosyltransferase PARP12-like [Mercenaria mercenaria]